MAVPSAVRKQAEESRKKLEELSEQQKQASEDQTDKVVTQPLESLIPKKTDEQTQPKPDITPKEPKPVVPDTQQTQAASEAEDLREMLKQAEHKLSSEIGRRGKLDAQVSEMSGMISSLRQEVQNLQGSLKKAETAVPVVPGEKRYLKPEEANELQEEIDLNSRIAKGVTEDIIGSKLGPINDRIAQIEKQTQDEINQIKEQSLRRVLVAQVPNALDLNRDPDFLEWLNHQETSSGLSRQQLLSDAVAKFDTDRVAYFFKTYNAEKGIGNDDKAKALANDERAKQIDPGQVKANAPVQEQTQPILSVVEIQKFYEDLSKGRYRGREAEAEAIRQQILTAAAEQRVA